MLPLIEPGPPLTPEQASRYSRHLMLERIGEEGQRRLAAARVLAIGAGGLGCPALLYLAAAGVGTLAVIDDDFVDRSNLHRQVLHTDASVGEPKVVSAARQLRELNPDIAVIEHFDRLTSANIDEIFSQYDIILDGTDNFQTRYLVTDACTRLGIPEIWGSILRFDGQVSVFWTGERAVAAGAPAPDGVSLRDLFPAPPDPGTVPACGDVGVIGSLPGQIGTMMATEAVKLICGIGEPLIGRVMVIDTLAANATAIPFAPRPLPRPEPLTDAQLAPYCAPPRVPEVTVAELSRHISDDDDRPVILDVREPDEVLAAALEGSVRIPLDKVLADPGAVAVRLKAFEKPLYVHCAKGGRSARATEALLNVGADAANVVGGIEAWQKAGLPVEKGTTTS